MKEKKIFKILESETSKVYLTKLEATCEYFEENHSPFVIVRVEEDLENIKKAYEALLQYPMLEKVSFFINSAYVLPKELYDRLAETQSDELFSRTRFDKENAIIEIEDINTGDYYCLSLAYATVKISEGYPELYYDGFVETLGRIHVQSDYFDLFSLLGINQEEEVLA